ncbi:hypothetical protein [Lichenibacterium ramalinae]|uniref:Uncharacterized protein n=1 Tax=Lichenibacterium ramalinae TaxID=2316527 RepID=A0A4Q2R8V9_9HYPH|nr:hypothetical protein [Lichenibacterium ramalinae]RYB01890.1 hypothetical protein D3272_23600 [Lichenibacterium ramalinae]
MKGTRWTKQDVATLTRMHSEGRTDIKIGAAIGRMNKAVHAQIHRLKAHGDGEEIESHKRRSTWTPANIAEAHRLIAEGQTQMQVARRLGTTE